MTLTKAQLALLLTLPMYSNQPNNYRSADMSALISKGLVSTSTADSEGYVLCRCTKAGRVVKDKAKKDDNGTANR